MRLNATIMSRSCHPAFRAILFVLLVTAFSACQQGDPNALDNVVSQERQIKVYQELRAATKKASRVTYVTYQNQENMDPADLRAMQDSLRLSFWQEVCDSNQVALAYGDSIWTKGVKEKWSLLLQ